MDTPTLETGAPGRRPVALRLVLGGRTHAHTSASTTPLCEGGVTEEERRALLDPLFALP